MPGTAWKKSVIYQIYPISFMDSNGDGIGDISGIISKLDYLKTLGVDYLWLSPVYESPMDDNGYDISDYYRIGRQFGTMDEMDRLIEQAHSRGLKIIMDLVANHTSDEHVWFQASKASKDNPYRDFYVWRKGVNGNPPSDMQSWFSGSAWEYDATTDEYYLHLFSKKQPDLNWQNNAMRHDMYRMINYWLDKGVDGFRMDVIDLVGKDIDRGITGNGPRLHEFIQEMHQVCFVGRDVMNVGETGGVRPDTAHLFTSPSRHELDLVFQFQHVALDEIQGQGKWALKPLHLPDLKRVMSIWQSSILGDGWNSLYWNNHDQPRIVSRWGNDQEYRVESAKALAIILHGMKGTPFIYQGEELGMTNLPPLPIEAYQDVETKNIYREKISHGWSHDQIMKSIATKGRDNARSPMQWSNRPFAGFSSTTPWLMVNPNYSYINAESALADADSIFHTYRQLIELRKSSPYSDTIVYGDYELLLPDHEQLYVYTRSSATQRLAVIANLSPTSVQLPLLFHIKQTLVSSYPGQQLGQGSKTLRPYEAYLVELV